MFIASSISPESIPAPVLWISGGMVGLAVILALARFLMGPSVPDRIIAVDLLAGLTMAGMLISGISSGNPFMLQAVLGFAVILFLGTIALARFLRQTDNEDS